MADLPTIPKRARRPGLEFPSPRELRALPVGTATIVIVLAGVLVAVIAGTSELVDSSAAAFGVVALLVGAMLGLAAWDLVISWAASKKIPSLALPETITLGLPDRVVPFLSPVAFVGGILLGHWFWS